ncbi:MAG: hypothetical protein ACM3PY_14750, partial [Omnitrophica WOR_2 bacterium]
MTIFYDGGLLLNLMKLSPGLHLIRLNSVASSRWKINQGLAGAIQQANPDVVLWHVGLSSFLHQALCRQVDRPSIGIFTSPIYRWKD